MTRSNSVPQVSDIPYATSAVGHSYSLLIMDDYAHRITKSTVVAMPVCPSDWATNDFAPFGNEAKQRAKEMQRYIKEKFRRNCTFFKRDGELFITFYVSRIAHREIDWFKRVFFLDDREHTFKDVGV